MAGFRKVVWAEGVMLGQQHFQQWENHLFDTQALTQAHTRPFHYGVADISFDEPLLALGKLSICRLTALMPDRRWINFNKQFDGQLIREIPTAQNKTLSVFVGFPSSHHVNNIAGYTGTADHLSAWKGEYQTIHDRYDPVRTREVLLAKLNLNVYFDGELSDDIIYLKIAELEFNLDQSVYRFSQEFIPSILHTSVSDNFSTWHKQLIGELTRHINKLSQQKDKYRHVHNQFGYGDFIYFNIIKTLTTYLPLLTALEAMPEIHPFKIYEICCALMGELWGYLDEPLAEKNIPVYQHHALTNTFKVLKEKIAGLIEKVVPVNTLDITLQQVKENCFETGSLSLADLKQKQFCLAFYHEDASQALIDKVKTQIKISSPSKLDDIVLTFTKGVTLDYLSSPGKDLLAKRDYHYFILNKQSPGWQDILAEAKITFFVSQELSSCQFELISY